jgi:hypothetical protein
MSIFRPKTFNPYREALKILDNGNHWGQGWGREEVDCMVSAMGFVSESYYGNASLLTNGTLLLPERIAAELFPDRCDKSAALWVFNDHKDTTFEDVRVVFERAAVEYDSRV